MAGSVRRGPEILGISGRTMTVILFGRPLTSAAAGRSPLGNYEGLLPRIVITAQ